MKFDDFNYEIYNPYILVQEDKKKNATVKDDKSKTDGIDSSMTGMEGLGGMGTGPALSVHALEQQKYGRYEFRSLSIDTPDNKDDPPKIQADLARQSTGDGEGIAVVKHHHPGAATE